MTDSILQTEKECFITGAETWLDLHHIYAGPNRKHSDAWGCWVWLRADWHNMSERGVHFNRELDLRIKRECQEAFEKLHGHEKFIEIFGKSYL